MIWEIELQPKNDDRERRRVSEEYALLTHAADHGVIQLTSRGYLVEGDLTRVQAHHLVDELLIDPLIETGTIRELSLSAGVDPRRVWTVLLKPGVMDPVAMSVIDAASDIDVNVRLVRTFRRYYIDGDRLTASADGALRRILANDAIEQIVDGPLTLDHLSVGAEYPFRVTTVPLRHLDGRALEDVSRRGQLSLSRVEMMAIQSHFEQHGRDPTDIELETLAQTWSEHCSHKTLKGRIDFEMIDPSGRRVLRSYDNLLKQTIFAATEDIRRKLGPDDWCVSVFEDNAGMVRFDDRHHACFKVETHNHPSAIEPYGGANTGLGGVIRDPLGTGLGAKPVCNTDVFCFGMPDTPAEDLPGGVLHPRKIITGVVAGVRDYGNRMGIPTVNGAVCFDDRYLANPLVFCGTVGLIPANRAAKSARPGDWIVVVGGRTGRDGIHGATFSSARLTGESEVVSGGAVQIGNAITEKKLLDVILPARDRGLYHAITDCGAGGFSSAVGEMGEKLGAAVHLDCAPVKYEGLSYTEIWISESQERMILAVPPESWPALQAWCASEDVEATTLGQFTDDGRLRLFYCGTQVGDLDMKFLHHGRPTVTRKAVWTARRVTKPGSGKSVSDFTPVLLQILSSLNVCSKEWIIRQYDHEVQGGSVLKPLVGAMNDGPGDAAVLAPVLGSTTGIAIGCGINPRYGDLDPYAMAAAAIDEAVRNVVAVGADPSRIALLDNFCWGDTDRPEVLGSLVRAAQACHDMALAYGMPFISGKDSLHNEYRSGDRHIAIPPTLLISALGRVPDIRRCVSMDLKEAANVLFLIGATKEEMGGSHYGLVLGCEGGAVPSPDLDLAPRLFSGLHNAMQMGLIRACHDLSEGGLAVAAAEMAFAGNIGVELTLSANIDPIVQLFAESCSRFLVEVRKTDCSALHEALRGLPVQEIGATHVETRLLIRSADGRRLMDASLGQLKEAWQKPLRW